MGYVLGRSTFGDGSDKFLLYEDTTDHALPQLFDTLIELEDHWQAPQTQTRCTCGDNHSEPVEVTVDYGNGITFPSMACRKCKVITGAKNQLEAVLANGESWGLV